MQTAAAPHIVAAQHLVADIAGETLRVVICCRYELERVCAALDKSLEAQLLCQCVFVHRSVDCFPHQQRRPVIEIRVDQTISLDCSVRVIDPQADELQRVARHEEVIKQNLRPDFLRREGRIGQRGGNGVFPSSLDRQSLNRHLIGCCRLQCFLGQYYSHFRSRGILHFTGFRVLHSPHLHDLPRRCASESRLVAQQQYPRRQCAALLQHQCLRLRVVRPFGSRVVQLCHVQFHGAIGGILPLLHSAHADEIHQRQYPQRGFFVHLNAHSDAGILQVVVPQIVVDDTTGECRRIHPLDSQNGIVHVRQARLIHTGWLRAVRPGHTDGVRLCKCQRVQGELILRSVFRILQHKPIRIVASQRCLIFPCAAQHHRFAGGERSQLHRSQIEWAQIALLILRQGLIRVMDSHF